MATLQDSIAEAKKMGASDDDILVRIYEDNPKLRESINEAGKRGATSSSIINEIIAQNSPKKTGFVQSVVQGIAKPFLRTAVTGVEAIDATGKLLRGDVKGAKESIGTKDFGYLGKITPVGLEAKNTGEFAKDVVGTGLDVGSTVASIATGSGATVGKEALRLGLAGALGGAGRAMQDKKGTEDILKEAFVNGVISGALGGAMKGISNTVSKVAKAAPEKLYNQAIGVTAKLEASGKSPAKELVDKGIVGDYGKIFGQVKKGAEVAESQIDDILNNSKKQVATSDVVDEAMSVLKKKFGNAYSQKQLEDALLKTPANSLYQSSSLNVAEANALRKELDKILGSTFFISDAKQSLQKEATGAIANVLRGKVQGTEPATQALFKDLSTYIRTEKVLANTMAKMNVKGFGGLTDIILGSAGAVAGAFGGGPMAGAAGATGLVAAKHAVTSPTVMTNAAVGISNLTKLVEKLPMDKAGNISKALLMNLLKAVISQPKEQSSIPLKTNTTVTMR